MTTFNLPDLGEGLTEAEIVTWHVSAGDRVVTDQPLVSVETDKAVVEIPSPFAGTVARLHAAVGDIIETGKPLLDIETGAATDAGAVVGELEAASPAPPPAAKPVKGGRAVRASATPAVRRLAQELGVDLASVTGTGPGGAILSNDVRQAAGRGTPEGQPLRGVRRAMARAMSAAGAVVVPATVTDFADISAWDAGETPMQRLVRAVCAGCAVEPALNAHFDGERRVLNTGVDLSIAVDTPDGLFAPVLRGADRMAPDEIAAGIAGLKAAVRDRSIAPELLRGGTITLSNFGTMGGEHAALVISPPQVGILGAGRIHDAVLAIDSAPVVRRVLPLSLTFDHRAVTGGEATRFLAAVRADLAAAT